MSGVNTVNHGSGVIVRAANLVLAADWEPAGAGVR